jgi:hypothetical protein
MYPIIVTAESPGAFAWELIRFQLTHSDGRPGILEAPVDPVTKAATADLQSRVRLHPRPHFVPDGDTYLIDPDFSDRITYTAESMTDGGTFPFGSGFLFTAVNMVPFGSENNLAEYIGGTDNGLRKWITPFTEPVVFRGYYSDVMIWLLPIEEDYILHTEYLNGADVRVGAVVTTPIPGNDKVQRIRLDASVDGLITSARLWVTYAGVITSQTLTVRYRA